MRKTWIVLILLAFFTAACAPSQSPEEIQAQIETSVAQTVAAKQQIEESVAQTVAAQNALASPTAVATNTPLSFPTLTPLVATITPFPTNPPSGGGGGGGGGGSTTSTKYSCAIVAEKPYDGAIYKPGDFFDKSWTIKNTGTETWAADWEFEYIKGTDMSPTGDRLLGQEVKKNKTITIVVEIEAPIVASKNSGQIFVMTWSLNNGSHFCTPYVAIQVVVPGAQP